MKKEDIEKSAMNYDSRAIAFRAFVKGAEWRINSVWHGVDEIPRAGARGIVEYMGGSIDLLCECERLGLWFKVIRWAYVDDLMPGKEVGI